MQIMYKIQNFTAEELCCPCCSLLNIKQNSLTKLQILRDRLGYPLHINSACRCVKHNKEVGGAVKSSHICTIDNASSAFDVAVNSDSERFNIIRIAIDLGFHRIGVYKSFIHLDDDITKRPAIWYGK